MANIKKNFNFRNGVQVDDDNLLVTETGLVGIGTTIPVEALDVRGNVVITGFTSATTQKVDFLTVTTLEPEKIIGAGISGLTLGLAHLKKNINVQIFEKEKEIEQRGAGINISPNGSSILYNLGLKEKINSFGKSLNQTWIHLFLLI